jgi:cyclopropane-fatty-acyl-phospholipid synthase
MEVNFEKLIKKTQASCPCCSNLAEEAINLPKYPVTEFYKEVDDKRNLFGFIDQNLLFCQSCNHLFLGKVLDASKIYNENNYITSSISSQGASECINDFVGFIKNTTDKSELNGSTLIDIGGNDSTLLKYFIGVTDHLINVDPNASSDNESISIHRDFLEKVDFSEFDSEKQKVFISSHTIEHLEDPAKLLRKLCKIINKNDILYLQFPSMEKLVEQGRYDQICHQHINYFSLSSISKLMESEGLYVQEYEYDTSHFGTLRVKIERSISSHVKYKSFDLADVVNTYSMFKNYYSSLNDSILDTFNNGQGFGAGLMVPTLAYNLPLIDDLSVIIDENPLRIEKKFINLMPPIYGIDNLDISKPVLITSISTKAAARAIFFKLISHGIKEICIPSTII